MGKNLDPGSGINIPVPQHSLHWKDVCPYSCDGIGSTSLAGEDAIGVNLDFLFISCFNNTVLLCRRC
jgi:hypothetical protein